MAADPSSRRLLRLLRRTARASRVGSGRASADAAALWSAQERAVGRAREAGAAAQRTATSAVRQRASLDGVADKVRSASSGVGDAQALFARVVDVFERLSLVALNAGLEGARFGEGPGRALALVGDEVRALAVRGSDAAREVSMALTRLASELADVETQTGQARQAVAEMTQDSATAAATAGEAEGALADLADRMKAATGSDPEAVRAIAEASAHTRALVTSLAALTGKVPRALLLGAIAPALGPLARLLGDEGLGEEEDAPTE